MVWGFKQFFFLVRILLYGLPFKVCFLDNKIDFCV